MRENKQLFCYEGGTIKCTQEGEKAISRNVTGLVENSLKGEEFFQEGKEGVHDPCQWAVQNRLGDIGEKNKFYESISKLWNNSDRSAEENIFLATTIRLAKTVPNEVPGWTGSKIHSNLIGTTWSA